MNERIRELERQAFDAVWDLDKDSTGPGTHFRPNGFEQKFAELIVRECIYYAFCHGDDIEYVKKHFGVEE